jgi:hypothetical protein
MNKRALVEYVSLRLEMTRVNKLMYIYIYKEYDWLDEWLLGFQYLFRSPFIFYRTCENETSTWTSGNILAGRRY